MTAQEQYQKTMADLRQNIAILQDTLDDHAEKQANNPQDWGYTGDLNMINERIEEVLFAIGSEPAQDND